MASCFSERRGLRVRSFSMRSNREHSNVRYEKAILMGRRCSTLSRVNAYQFADGLVVGLVWRHKAGSNALISYRLSV